MDLHASSPWAVAALNSFQKTDSVNLFTRNDGYLEYLIFKTDGSLWVKVRMKDGPEIAFRVAFAPGNTLHIIESGKAGDELKLRIQSGIGQISVVISWPSAEVLRYKVDLTPSADLYVPFWPKDILIPDENHVGEVKVSQIGSRTGLLYINFQQPLQGSVLYLQDLTSLSDYCEQTHTSLADTVNGRWPELGFSLPPAVLQPLKAGKSVTISNAIVVFKPKSPESEFAMARQFLDMLAEAYLQLSHPETRYHNWKEILDKGLKDLKNNSGCWMQVKGLQYVNAYVCDYETPPEIMVQLAVLLPLLDYQDWSGSKIDITDTITKVLPQFYDPELKSIRRWLPAAQEKLKGEEE